MFGSDAQADCHFVIQFRQTPAGQVVHQVAGAQLNYFTSPFPYRCPPTFLPESFLFFLHHLLAITALSVMVIQVCRGPPGCCDNRLVSV